MIDLKEKKLQQDMVSIIVLTYNSEKYIKETLKSIEKQTYKNLEVIIADDGSKDNTIDICTKWSANIEYKVKIVTTNINTGISKNINRGIKKSFGKWIKPIAGDDILEEKCIEKNIKFVKENNCEIVFSNLAIFYNKFNKNKLIKQKIMDKKFFSKNAQKQFQELLSENKVFAPTSFIKREMLEKNNFFEEKYPMVEDYPTWLKLTKSGIKLNYFDDVTVFYRRSEKSLSYNKQELINIKMFEFRKQIYNNYIKYETKNWYFHYREKLLWKKFENIIRNGNNKKTFFYYFCFLLEIETIPKIIKKIFKN